MKSLKVKNILDKGAEKDMSKDIKRNEDIREIEEALEEKRIRETQNLDLRLKKDKLCAEMRKIDEINGILNSTSHNGLGCPIGGEVVEYEHKTAECKHVCHPVEEDKSKELEEVLKEEENKSDEEKKVICLDTLDVYENAKDAESKTPAKASAITRNCNGNSKRAGGLRWMYYKDYLLQENK